jgi:hypothetical protein
MHRRPDLSSSLNISSSAEKQRVETVERVETVIVTLNRKRRGMAPLIAEVGQSRSDSEIVKREDVRVSFEFIGTVRESNPQSVECVLRRVRS